MSKSCCFAVVLAVICLSVILLSLQANAHPIADESPPWSAATLEVRIIPSNQQQQNGKIKESCEEANETTTLEEVVNMVKVIALNQQENAKEIRDLKRLFVSGSVKTNETSLETVVKEIKDDVKALKRLLTTKQALVSALVSNCVPLLIQQNVDGSNFFNRSWAEFKVGFGDPSGNYWLGNELLSQLTANNSYKLKFDLQSRDNNNWYYAEYSTFIVQTESDNYRLQVAGYSGNAGRDSFRSTHHNGQMFSTYDRDNDRWSSHCAAYYGGGFWYGTCSHCDVNSARIFYWFGLPGGGALQSSRMWLQCK